MRVPRIAVVGRPNVGKSTLFNRIVGKRISIVEDTPGVTRDRIYADFEWRGRYCKLIDTGGIEVFSDDEMLSHIREQAEIAINAADVIILVTDVKTGVTAMDEEIARILQKSGKPIVLCVNKCDTVGQTPLEVYEFYSLGLGEPFPVSSVHGQGTGDLLDEVYEKLDNIPTELEYEDPELIRVAVVGKPNVGKSSLINYIVGETRSIVSNIAGTTRDAIDTEFTNDNGKYIFIDTAGIRRKSKVDENIERYSVLRAFLAVDRADVCIIMIDATEGFSEQDSKIAGYAHEAGKASIVVVNKWDIVDKEETNMPDFQKQLQGDFAFMAYVPFIFISATTGKRIDKLFPLINHVNEQNNMRISTGKLNEMLANATSRVQPPSDRGRRLKIYYMTQSATKPPTFVCFTNSKKLFHFSYQRYLENQIRETFGLKNTPIKMVVRERG